MPTACAVTSGGVWNTPTCPAPRRVPYYTRLERGDARGDTNAVLDAIARALLLDDAERAHLFNLVRAANATAAAQATRRPARQPVRPELRTCWRR